MQTGMISIRNLSYRFHDNRRDALHEVNLDVAPGEFLIITGPSGCGKSTLALAIGGYLFRQYDGRASGMVLVGEMDVRQRPIYEVAEVVGLVQQNPEAQFCTLTVQDEVAFGLENRCLPAAEIWERLTWALDVVGASHLIKRSLSTLSGGEKQRIAIAAVMAARPQVLILDEPTSNLDPTATREILDVIARLRETARQHDEAPMTVIVIEHKVGYLRPHAPRLVAMKEGRMVANAHIADNCTAARQGAPLRPSARAPAGKEAVLHVEDLRVAYDGSPVLRDVSLKAHSGEFVALMGDNGSGKTTLLLSLLGLIKANAGSVTVLGHSTHSTPTSELARHVGYVFQNPDHQLFADSVWQEATFALRNHGRLDPSTEAWSSWLLGRFGLKDRHEDHPYRLSYGEKRRLNLVSILGHRPQLLLLDEILIGQDMANVAFLMDLLWEQVKRGCTVIMVNHHPEVTAQYASRLVFLEKGQVLIDAATEEGFRRLADLGREAYLPATWQKHAVKATGCPSKAALSQGAIG
jgi:energy-coupling factor transport system ATP-binding protein